MRSHHDRPEKSSPKIRRVNDGYWEWFISSVPPGGRITGKYLFFSADRELLVQIVIDELRSGAFHLAKTQEEGKSLTREYVLCLYDIDDSRKHELAAKYRGRARLKYRYWKTDEATRRGQYSKEFLKQLSPEMKPEFTDRRTRLVAKPARRKGAKPGKKTKAG